MMFLPVVLAINDKHTLPVNMPTNFPIANDFVIMALLSS